MQTAISQATGSLPVDLPSPPTFSKTNPNDQPIMYIALTSDSVTRGQLYDYGSTQVGQRISILPGVSRVRVFGTKSAIRIKADPSAMWARGISVDDLAAAIKNGTSYTGAGQFDGSAGTSLLRPQGQLDSAEAYSNLIVSSQERLPGLSARRGPGRAIPSRTSASTCGSGCAAIRFRRPRWSWRSIARPAPTPWRWPRASAELLPLISAELPGSVRVTPIYDRSQTIVHSVTDVQATLADRLRAGGGR